MSIAQNPKESLMSIYIKRAYWAVSNIHNKVFFNRAEETYITPDREDEIVALLTEQDPIEVALLRITREIIKKAEEEQPEKKINIDKQSKDIIIIEEPAIKQPLNKKKETQQHKNKENRNQEDPDETTKKKKTENKEITRKEVQ